MIDDIDKQILNILQSEGRLNNVDLAERINLSPPATHARLKRLEKEGYIAQYVAIVDKEKVGYDGICFINVSLQLHQVAQVESFRTAIQDIPEVMECHHITGEFDYLLKVAIRSRKDLETFVVDRLTPLPGVARIYTSLALSEVKSSTKIPL